MSAPNSFVDAFPDPSGSIVKTFFTSTDVTEKTWSSAKLLADADDTTFWTVVANHRRLGAALTNLITAADVSHSSSSAAQRKSVTKENEASLCALVIRLATTTQYCTEEKGVLPADMARRLDAVLPLPSLFPTAVMLFRKSGAAASIVLTSLFLLNPSYLCRLQLHLSSWFDQVNRLATRCQAEMLRGRYQRLSGDVLPLFELMYRTTKHLWAMLQSVPFIADYVPVTRTLRSLRIVFDVVSPALQHFVMTCEALQTRRDVLSKANALTVNTVLNASSILLLFHTFNRPRGQRDWVLGRIPKATYESLEAFMAQYVRGTPERLLASLDHGRHVHTLMHQLSQPLDNGEDAQVGQVILSLFEPISDSKDLSQLMLATRKRFGESVLLQLVQEGVSLDALLSARFVTPEEAATLGASEDSIRRAMAGLPTEEPAPEKRSPAPVAAKAAAPAKAKEKEKAKEETDPLVDMVAEVFPHFNRHGIRAALNYYNNDSEQFILDASIENIPPHLFSQVTAPSTEEAIAHAEVPAQAAANAAIAENMEVNCGARSGSRSEHLTADDFADDADMADEQLYLGRDLYELITGSDRDNDAYHEDGADQEDGGGAAADYQDYASYRKAEAGELYGGAAGGVSGAGAFGNGIDDEMRERIRMLTEMMYDDELDDAQMGEMRAVNNGGTDTDEEDEVAGGDGGGYARDDAYGNRGGAAPPAAAGEYRGPVREGAAQESNAPPPRSEYDAKQFRTRMARERSKAVKEKAAQRDDERAAYSKKQKTSKHQKGGGGGKNALTRAFKKGTVM